jgi:hypothetical protein
LAIKIPALKIPSTNPHYLSAERLAKALKKTIPILIRKGVLLPPSQSVKSPAPSSPSTERPLPK